MTTLEASLITFEEPPLTEEQLHAEELHCIAEVQQGNPQAFEPLFKQHFPRLRNMLARNLGHDQAEDIAQRTLTRAWLVLQEGGFQDRGQGMKQWLGILARNLVRDDYRRADNRQVSPMPVEDFASDISAPDDVEQAATRGMQTDWLRGRLGELVPTSQLDAMTAVYIEGKSIREHAAEADVLPATVRTRLFRARQAIHQHPDFQELRDSLKQ